MRTISFAIVFLLGIQSSFASEEGFSYEKNGDDWPEKYPECAGPTQSPIDLPALGGNIKINTISYSEDNFVKRYQNPLNAVVKWVGDTTKVVLPTMKDKKSDMPNFFMSQYGSKDMQSEET